MNMLQSIWMSTLWIECTEYCTPVLYVELSAGQWESFLFAWWEKVPSLVDLEYLCKWHNSRNTLWQKNEAYRKTYCLLQLLTVCPANSQDPHNPLRNTSPLLCFSRLSPECLSLSTLSIFSLPSGHKVNIFAQYLPTPAADIYMYAWV